MFKALHTKFERNETDLFELQQEEQFSRYLLVRSLANDHLKELIERETELPTTKTRSEDLYLELFNLSTTNDQIINYIKEKYPKVREERKKQEEYLPEIINNFGEVKCGIRNDNLNDTAKDLVRDKTIQTKEDLEERVNELLDGTIRGYILWQYYNQVTNDLIEHIFNDHENVIPTLRKIKYVDFMVNVDGKIIPFDLKITHISDDYFDLFKKGLTPSQDTTDDFQIGENQSEMEAIKEYYKSIKVKYELPNYGGLKKIELLNILSKIEDDETKQFLQKIKVGRKSMINEIKEKLRSLEWWNYKFQGERLFKNNNRFFVFLAYEDSFEDARPLKGKLAAIKEKVDQKLDQIKDGNLNKINYYYTKDRGLEGKYVVNSTSVLVTE